MLYSEIFVTFNNREVRKNFPVTVYVFVNRIYEIFINVSMSLTRKDILTEDCLQF